MILVAETQQHFEFDPHLQPVARAISGSVVRFETLDACCGEVRSTEQFIARRKSGHPSNPLSGPVFVEGARPGHTLRIEILDIQLHDEGFQLVGPQRGIVRDELDTWRCHAFRVVADRIIFPNGIQARTAPVVGTFGNAPRDCRTSHANPLGGNLDAPAARIGAILYVPVEVEGGLFSLGDVHACQGGGEVVGAPEIGARVTVRITVLEYSHAEWCMIEDDTSWHSICSAPTEADAAKIAVFQNARFLARHRELDLSDALVVLTLAGKLSICRTGLWGGQHPVVDASFPKACLNGLTAAVSTHESHCLPL